MGGESVARATCQLVPPSMPSYRRYCPYTRGSGWIADFPLPANFYELIASARIKGNYPINL